MSRLQFAIAFASQLDSLPFGASFEMKPKAVEAMKRPYEAYVRACTDDRMLGLPNVDCDLILFLSGFDTHESCFFCININVTHGYP
jgi:hypothetical protein